MYSHAASPLRKSASTNYLREREGGRERDSLGGTGERRAVSPSKRDGSPLKRISTPLGGVGYTGLGVGRRESGRF